MKKSTKEIIAKVSLVYAIGEVIDSYGKVYMEGGYESYNDLVSFKCDGHSCKLAEVLGADLEKGTITLTVWAKGAELKDWEKLTLDFDATHFRYSTLYKIALETYMCSNLPADDVDDGDEWLKQKIADFFDTFGYSD